MGKKFDKFKTWVKEHKAEIALGAAAVGVIGLGVAIANRKDKLVIDLDNITTDSYGDLPIPKLSVGKIDDVWNDNAGVSAIVNDINPDTIGVASKEIAAMYDLPKDCTITAVLGFLPNEKLNNE